MTRIRLYYNLHRHCLSVQQRGRVAGHAAAAVLAGVRFNVSEAGRQRVLRERVKNVHATIEGQPVAFVPAAAGPGVLVTYNPYAGPYFFEVASGLPIHEAAYVVVTGKTITAYKEAACLLALAS